MGPEGNAAASPSSSSMSPTVKRGRDPEDEVYVDNLRSHKRYLSEIMASSLNGLTVGDSLPEDLMDSPLRYEGIPSFRDDISVQYSPMSEDSDDSRYYESSTNTCPSQPESAPTSPVSPYRCQKPLSGFMPGPSTSYYSHGSVRSTTSVQTRQRGSDNEGRFPSSPSDICHSADLRRSALLRSVQMRTQPISSSPYELPLTQGHDCMNAIEPEERPCSYIKLDIDNRGYPIGECTTLSAAEHHENGECTSLTVADHEIEKSRNETLTTELKGANASSGE